MSAVERGAVLPQERVIFANGVEGLFVRGLAGRLDDGTRAALKGVGLDLNQLRPGYPVSLWRRAVEVVVSQALADRSPAEAYRFLGERSVLGLGETLLGKAMVGLAQVVGPVRTLRRLPHSIRSGDNYSGCRVEERGERWFEVEVQPYLLPPEYMEGVLAAVVTLTGGQRPAVRTLEYAADRELIRIEVKWG